MKSIGRSLGWATVVLLAVVSSAAAKQGFGTISGVVLDPSGTPQMGASVWLISEDVGRTVAQLNSDQHGAFFSDRVKPGQYAVRVAVQRIPAGDGTPRRGDLQPHNPAPRASRNRIFLSRFPAAEIRYRPSEQDDWKWVLRSSTATRTILQWDDSSGQISSASLGSETFPARADRTAWCR